MQRRSNSRQSSTYSEHNNQDQVEPNNRLFVSGLTLEADENQIKAMFANCGSLTGFYMRKQENGRAFCLVTMSTMEEAKQAIAKLHGRKIDNKMMWVRYSKPKVPKEEKKEGYGASKQTFGQSKGNFNNKRDDNFKNYGNYNQNYKGRKEGESREHRGRFNHNDQEAGNRNPRQNNFHHHDKQDYQLAKESNRFGRIEEGRVEQGPSKKTCDEQDY